MSDSESDLLPSSVFRFQNENTTVCAKGPNINNANFTNLSFRNNVMTSTMHMSRNFGRSRYGEPSFDQRSMCYRRETSPMSLYSGSDMRGRNQSYYHGGMSSQRSMYNGRSGSPMSMRSIDSNASMSAVDIAMAFKNVKFNKYDLRMIKEAYNKFMKRRIRKKVEKRRNMRLFLKGYRRKSGYDSGEQGSDSSISSDDCKSTTSAMYKDNMSSSRSTRTDLTDFRRRIKESNMYNDCTDNFKQNAMKNMFQVPPTNSRERFQAPSSLPPSTVYTQQGFTQKERFKNGFLLPSQRFNKSIASVPIPERDRLQGNQNTLKQNNQINKGHLVTQKRVNNEMDSDQEDIFSEITVRENNTLNYEPQYDKITEPGKRSLEDEENSYSNRKRTRLSSPAKAQKPNGLTKLSKKANGKIVMDNNGPSGDTNSQGSKVSANNNDFEFIKPQLPVRKSGLGKTKDKAPKEKLISKSAPPLVDAIMPPNIVNCENKTVPVTRVSEEKQTTEEQPDSTQNSTSDLSMRPSFIKRKLFSQKMDVTERKNLSNEAINVNSPQTNVYSAIQNEKHKARKLVTNQSCLSRDVVKEDNNLLDLIHKIVPPDRMNVTNVTNKTSISNSLSSKNNQIDEEDKWDVTSVISTCNNDNVSDTYTDEEIFATDEKNKKTNATDERKKKTTDVKVAKNSNNVDNMKKISDCKILVEKLPKNKLATTNPVVVVNKTVPGEENDNLKKSVYSCVKSFWDTDFESDVESTISKRWTSSVKENQMAVKENRNKSIIMEADKTIKNKNNFNMSLASVSESIKSKTMPTNNMGKLKLNISKQLSVKSFLSPKNKQSKTKEQKLNQNIKQIEDCSKPDNSEPEIKTKQYNKQSTTLKSKNNNSNLSKNKNNDKIKPTPTDNDNNNETMPTPNKTKNNKTTEPTYKTKRNNKTTPSPNKTKPINNKGKPSSNNKKVGKPQNKTKSNNKSSQSLNETKNNNSKQSPKQTKVKRGRPPNKKSVENVADKSISVRSHRTPKRKACCAALDHEIFSKPVSNSNGNPNKKSKLVDSSPDQIQLVKKLNDRKQNGRKNNSDKNKEHVKPETDLSLVYESETSNRTLRSRRIDLSTSINSSTEHLTTLKRRNLRTRLDLSSSLKNSSLDDNVTTIKNPRSKAQAKRPGAKPGYAELLDKRRRR